MDVLVDLEEGRDCLVKIQDAAWEVNLRASATELAQLRDLRSADWDARRSIRVGRSAGSSAWWSSSGDIATLLIGDDDETWDIAFTLPLAIVDEIVLQAEGQTA